MGQRKSRVPDTFQLGAIPDARAFLAGRKINNLCVFNEPDYSDSPRLHAFNYCVINGLRRMFGVNVPLAFNESDAAPVMAGLQGIRSTSSAIMRVSSTREAGQVDVGSRIPLGPPLPFNELCARAFSPDRLLFW
jgi:hypothetical protein